MLDRMLFRFTGMRTALVVTFALVLLRVACVVGQAFSLALAIASLWEGVATGWFESGIAVDIIIFLACFVMRSAVVAIQNAYLERYARARAMETRHDLLGAIYDLGNAGTSRYGSAGLVASAIEGIDDIENYISLMVPKIVALVVVPIVILVIVFLFDWVSGIILLACYPLTIVAMVLLGYTAQDDSAKRYEEYMRMSNQFIDSLRGIDTLKAFGKGRMWEQRVYAASERFRVLAMRTLRVATLSSAVLDLIATLGVAAVAIVLALRLIDGSIDFFPALAVFIMAPEYFNPLREFGADYHASLNGSTALSQVISTIEEGRAAHGSGEEIPAEGVSAQPPEIAFEDVSVAYDDVTQEDSQPKARREENSQAAQARRGRRRSKEGKEASEQQPQASDAARQPEAGEPRAQQQSRMQRIALADVSFQVTGPAKIGIIGASGAGKSTLMDTLAGFLEPTGGSIEIDGIAVSSLHDRSWHARQAFITQDPYIFRMSLRDNVALYYPAATDDEVLGALDRAGLGALPSELSEGTNTVIGDGARTLSGGQKQRVALARAFLDPTRDVLFFDEPTAHLDLETEMEIKENMLPLMEGRLVFFATHRLHWVADMDYLIELDHGRVVWQGAADEWQGAARYTDALPTSGEEAASGAVQSADEGGAR